MLLVLHTWAQTSALPYIIGCVGRKQKEEGRESLCPGNREAESESPVRLRVTPVLGPEPQAASEFSSQGTYGQTATGGKTLVGKVEVQSQIDRKICRVQGYKQGLSHYKNTHQSGFDTGAVALGTGIPLPQTSLQAGRLCRLPAAQG